MIVNYYSHLGVTVPDLDVARRFYVRGLGFRPLHDAAGRYRGKTVSEALGNAVGKILEFDEFDVTTEFIERDGQVLELVEYHNPPPVTDERQPMNNCAPTHLCFLVDGIDEVAENLQELGGRVLEHTRITTDLPDGQLRTYMFVLSPDGGTRVELIQSTAGLPNT